MEAKEAIARAKRHISEMFADELTSPPTLEEIWFDERKKEWFITLGVRRPSNDVVRDPWTDPLAGKTRLAPDYKVVRIGEGRRIPIVVDREAVKI